MVLREQLDRCVRVGGRDDADEAEAHVEDLVHLFVRDLAELLDQAEDGRDVERVRELVADVAGEAQEVVQAVAGDVGEAADVGVGGEQLEHRAHVDRVGSSTMSPSGRPRRSSSHDTSARTLRASV